MLRILLGLVFLLVASQPLRASLENEESMAADRPGTELRIAVASNFAATARALAEAYALLSNDTVHFLVGATGKHASQIVYGLDVDVFLAADLARPKFLEDNGHAILGSRSTYAIGRLGLWSKEPSLVDDEGDVLSSNNFNHLAIANPKTAPYGVAAMQVLSKLGVSPTIVKGESVGQAYLFANSGHAELALIAYAQVKQLTMGSHWLVPENLHHVIEQQLVLIKNSVAAQEFLVFLGSEPALTIIENYGYQRPNSHTANP